MTRQSHRAAVDLVRRSHCCGARIEIVNARAWCVECGTQVLRPTDVFHVFSSEPAPVEAPAPTREKRARAKRISDDQGALL
jgi:hypothetical protein